MITYIALFINGELAANPGRGGCIEVCIDRAFFVLYNLLY